MPNPGLTREEMQEAVNLFERHGGNKLRAAKAAGIAHATFRNRLLQGQAAGLRPTEFKPEVKIHHRERIGRVHMVIPDVQAKPNVPHEHMEWIANYAIEKRPDQIIQIGDWADIPSLCLYDKGKRCYEGRRYVRDIEAANYSLERFERPIEDYN